MPKNTTVLEPVAQKEKEGQGFAITHLVVIKAPAQSVYKALTEEQGLAGWWTKDVKAQPKTNSTARFSFGDLATLEMKIAELLPSELVKWRCEQGSPDWVGTKLTFKLSGSGSDTTVLFAHEGWRQRSEHMAHCSTKWAIFLLSLKYLLETGKGRPYPDDIKITTEDM